MSSKSPNRINVVGIVGSLRRGSYNRALLQAATEVAPAGLMVDIVEIGDLPLYDDDANNAGPPPVVQHLKDRVSASDGLLVVTPEYQHSIPGVLKNALDWLCRPGGTSPLSGLPAGMMGASPGFTGTARAQAHLRVIFASNHMPIVPAREILVFDAKNRFDENMKLVDDTTRTFVTEYMVAFERWIQTVRTAS